MSDSLSAQLSIQINAMVQYLQLKVQQRDWHGVADAAMDLRELEARRDLLEELRAHAEHVEGHANRGV